MLLAGDIGGTKTTLAVFPSDEEPRSPLAEATFPSGEYPSLEAIVQEFLGEVKLSVQQAGFGVAGPVVGGRATITNLPWVVDATTIAREFSLASVALLNDLAAIATAVPHLGPDDLHTINVGEPSPGGAIAVIAPGTGLGEAYLTWNGSGYVAHGSEGGHSDFAATTRDEADLLCYLLDRFEHVSYERVCSGIGLPNIYRWLKDSGRHVEEPWLGESLAGTADWTPVIVNAALNPERVSPLCVATLETFVSILAAEAGNLAIKMLATGGIYLGGGIPPRILSLLTLERFMPVFRAKGRMSDLLDRMPVHVIRNPKVALMGAAYAGMKG
jgi:glucokinase